MTTTSLSELVRDMRAVVEDGDAHGMAATHSTTIHTRQLLERAANAIESLTHTEVQGDGGEPPASQAWQKIETAPRMKGIILFAVTEQSNDGKVLNWRMGSGFYHEGWTGNDAMRNWSPWNWDGQHIPPWGTLPTHWMPLPEPPSSSSEAEGEAAPNSPQANIQR